MFKQERDYDRYALGRLLGGTEGAQLLASARAALTKCGITDPDANMRAYIPELMRRLCEHGIAPPGRPGVTMPLKALSAYATA